MRLGNAGASLVEQSVATSAGLPSQFGRRWARSRLVKLLIERVAEAGLVRRRSTLLLEGMTIVRS